MSNTLYICEKPSQARDIARILNVHQRDEGCIKGDGIIVTWCLGHLLELAPPDNYCDNLKPWRMDVLPVLPNAWELLPKDNTKSQLKVIARLLKMANSVIIATDADREGDVIGRELLDYHGYQGEVKRLWLSALDDASIKKGLANIRPGQSTYPLYQAGTSRQRADWSIGMNMTMAASALFGTAGQGVLSIGRVQTPTLALVVQRDLDIEDFQPKDFFELEVRFKSEPGDFTAKWQTSENVTDEEGRCLKRSDVEAIANKVNGQAGVVTEFNDHHKKTSAPVCCSLSFLQKVCNSKFGFTAKQTLQIAQSLYEKYKATTYPRTDTGYLPVNQFKESESVLKAINSIDPDLMPLINSCDTTYQSPTWNDKKVTAHHGIIPTTNTDVSLQAMTADERKVYDLIRRYYIAQFLGDYQFTQRRVILLCEDESFLAQNNIPQVLGWKQAMQQDSTNGEKVSSSEKSMIPKLSKGDKANVTHHEIISKQTKPPARFTEGTLIAAMKNIAKFVDDANLKKTLRDTAGIGTEATRADIIEKLIYRGFLDRNKKQLISSKRGRALIDIVPNQMKNPGTTALWEQALDDIAQGNGKAEELLLGQEGVLKEMLRDLTALGKTKKQIVTPAAGENEYPCPKCKAALIRRKSKRGFFWGCSCYPQCDGLMSDKRGKPEVKQAVTVSDIECPGCKKGKLVRRKAKKKGFWWGCNQYPECKAMYFDEKGEPKLDSPQK